MEAGRRRLGRRERAHGATATGRRAVGSGFLLVARVVMLVTTVVVGLIVAAILLRVLEANASNSIVETVNDIGKALVGPFDNVFSIDNPKTSIAVNWGLAALVYFIVGSLIARVLRRMGVKSHPDRV